MKRPMKKTAADITPEQLDALRAYAEWAGDGWQLKLRLDWLRGGSRWDGEWAPLQQLRNRIGSALFAMEVV